MLKHLVTFFLCISFYGCNDSTLVDNIKESMNGENTSEGLLFEDEFLVDGQLTNPWQATMQADPIPEVSSGKLTAPDAAFRSAQVATIDEENMYSEVQFQFSSPAPDGTSVILPLRHKAGVGVVFCNFSINSNVLEVSFRSSSNASSSVVNSSITGDDLSLHKLGCEVETNGNDIVMKAYIDPSVNAKTPIHTHTFVGEAATLVSGSAVIVFRANGVLSLDQFKVYDGLPY